MLIALRKSLALGFFGIGLSLLPNTAQADNLPNVQNLNFVDFTGAAPKNSFSTVNPVGWTGGTGLIYIDAPGTATSTSGGIGVYGPFPNNSPVGGNFVEADGNPDFESGFNQVITGLTPGTTYTLSFWQAGGQQQGFANGQNTTEQWIVSLGTAGLSVCSGCGAADPVYGGHDGTFSNSDPNASIAMTDLMTTPSGGVTPWELVTVSLKADATTDVLSFLAWGDHGNNINLPPMVFLAGVENVNIATPEPGSIVLFGSVLLGVGFAIWRRQRAVTISQ